MPSPTVRVSSPLLQLVAAAGTWTMNLFWYAGSLGLLFTQTVGKCFTQPLRTRAVIYELWRIGVGSWFIVSLVALFIGMVLAFQSAYQMQKIAAEVYIASLVSLSIIREIGPVMAGLIISGRVGSSIAAELGTMKVTEQVDALQTLGTDPVRYLIVPRFVALLIAVPLLTLWSDAVGIFGGFMIGTMKLGILPSVYWKMTMLPLVFKDLGSGLLKAFVFGIIICIVSCFEGLRAEGGAEGVGRATTVAVVTSFMLIIASDLLFTAMFYFVWT